MKKFLFVMLISALFFSFFAHTQRQSLKAERAFSGKDIFYTKAEYKHSPNAERRVPAGYFLLNRKNNKYHVQSCKYAKMMKDFEYIAPEKIGKQHIPCGFCIRKEKEIAKTRKEKNFDANLGAISIYFTDFTATLRPSSSCTSPACLSLVREIDSARVSIDFAVYGVEGQPKVVDALERANHRGVKIRWVTDLNANGENTYSDTKRVMEKLADYKTDFGGSVHNTELKAPRSYSSALMHNKFFIFDEKTVWTGSANITNTDLSGFNANTIILIRSKRVAEAYQSEFEQLYSGKFHTLKSASKENENLKLAGNAEISVYFSPKDQTITRKIIPLVNQSKRYIYIPSFVITHKALCDALVEAKKRGVEIKIILDSTSASNKNSKHKLLQEAGIPVKSENLAGKMHSKSVIIDDEYAILGSMNLSRSGEIANDENTVIIKSPVITKIMKSQFLYFWSFIPEKWLTKIPPAESFASIGSCYDGVDNDFDGKIDSKDPGCFTKR